MMVATPAAAAASAAAADVVVVVVVVVVAVVVVVVIVVVSFVAVGCGIFGFVNISYKTRNFSLHFHFFSLFLLSRKPSNSNTEMSITGILNCFSLLPFSMTQC